MADSSPKKCFSPLALWAMSFGCCVGWGAFVMPATIFLPMGGPMGSCVGLVPGMLAMMVSAATTAFSPHGIPTAAPEPMPMSAT